MDNNLATSQGAFNISLGSLERINMILTGCSISSFKNDIQGWCLGIQCLRKESRVFFNEAEKKKNNGEEKDGNKIKGFEEELDEWFNWFLSLTEEQKKHAMQTRGISERYLKMIKFLESYENFLREVLHRKGLLLKMEKDATKAAIDL